MKNEHAKTVKLKISIDRAGIASLKRLFRELGKLNTRIEATSTEVIRAIVLMEDKASSKKRSGTEGGGEQDENLRRRTL